MRVASLYASRALRFTSAVIDSVILCAVLILLAFGAFNLWDFERIYSQVSPSNFEIYKPTQDTQDGENLSFVELQTINPEVIAWLCIYGTHIDYPVTQGSDNIKYVNTNAKGQRSLSGALFLDASASPDFRDFSSVIYGHHMEKNAMFGEIGLFSDERYFEEHRYGTLYFGNKTHGLEFFAFLRVDAYDTEVFKTKITDIKDKEAYLDLLFKRALRTSEANVTTADTLVLLSTCSTKTTNGRDVLVARLTPEVFSDAFATRDADVKALFAIDRLPLLWANIPLWVKWVFLAWVFLAAGILAIAVALFWLRYRARRRAAQEDST
jgi:sortase B